MKCESPFSAGRSFIEPTPTQLPTVQLRTLGQLSHNRRPLGSVIWFNMLFSVSVVRSRAPGCAAGKKAAASVVALRRGGYGYFRSLPTGPGRPSRRGGGGVAMERAFLRGGHSNIVADVVHAALRVDLVTFTSISSPMVQTSSTFSRGGRHLADVQHASLPPVSSMKAAKFMMRTTLPRYTSPTRYHWRGLR
jgi:hypothetical protein